MSAIPTRTLTNGDQIPVIGAGTWDLSGETVKQSVRCALETGYTHVDTAEGYKNEAEIGEILAEYDRDEIFITSKVLPKHLNYGSVFEACRDSIRKLDVEYLDLYLIHWPNPTISIRETWSALEQLVEQGYVKNIGVSNFSGYQLSALQHIADIPVAVNQIEYNPLYARSELLEYCHTTDVVVEAAAPFGRGKVFDHQTVREIAEKHNRSPAQVALRWAIENDIVVLPKSRSPDHIRSNFNLFDWELDTTDHEKIDGIEVSDPAYDSVDRDWTRDTYGIPK
ncbi:aldo/keto reductase [Haloarcula sp. CBA1130]|uniref:aldo/keto reductase n=1 Tax=unclassified Haloarcula TaxID=2624677 RepID=UPI001248B1CA|nr:MULTISPECIES: aldo/keto reductase [unclassified Haloarcula]KAA9396243.1 aldo/keto reductase [Haloarcula sp. CBA1130]KAA9398312.1 aldo/keto reductase [Haloarcula sp. CBA1129]